MTVQELVHLLNEFPGDLEVMIQKDSEGNGYELVWGVEEAMRYGDRWDWEIYNTHEQLDRLMATQPYWSEEDRAPEGSVTVVVIHP